MYPSWQIEARQKVNKDIKSTGTKNRNKLVQMKNKLNNIEEKLSDSLSVACHAATSQGTDKTRMSVHLLVTLSTMAAVIAVKMLLTMMLLMVMGV
jgi:Flp pilus assembly protein TadB